MGLKNKYANPLPQYSAGSEENKWYRYCVNNNIRISQKPVDGEKCWINIEYTEASVELDTKIVNNYKIINEK